MHFSGSRLCGLGARSGDGSGGADLHAALAAGALAGNDPVLDEVAADRGAAAVVDDVLDELAPEVLERGEHRVGRGLAEPAEGAALHHEGEPLQPVEVGELGLAPADGVEDLDEVAGADAAGHALAARLGLREAEEVAGRVDDAGVLVEDDEAAGADDRAGGRQVLVVERGVEELLAEAAAGRPSRLHRLEALGDPAADVLDDAAERRAERHLDQPGPADLADQAEGLGPPGGLGAEGRVPVPRRRSRSPGGSRASRRCR